MVYVFMILLIFFFFFKQKTAYEMRISDWSSDVCSSDLCAQRRQILRRVDVEQFVGGGDDMVCFQDHLARAAVAGEAHQPIEAMLAEQCGRARADAIARGEDRVGAVGIIEQPIDVRDRKSTRLNSSH